MDEELKRVDVFIGTSIRGPGKRTGKSMYVMRYMRKNGEPYESDPEVAQYEQATESRLVLYAIRDALGRMNYACEVVLHTECSYVAAAFHQNWTEQWQQNGWKNKKGKDVADSTLWNDILLELEQSGHIIRVEEGKHEYSDWMQWKFQFVKVMNDVFVKIEKN